MKFYKRKIIWVKLGVFPILNYYFMVYHFKLQTIEN